MIEIMDIRTAGKRRAEFDEIWAIVRSMKHPILDFKQVSTLSPSTGLFFDYRKIAQAGDWNKQMFETWYVSRFIQNIAADPEAHKALNKLYYADKQGQNIGLCCFCTDETMCHRSIIAGLLQGTGVNVKTATGNDYSQYFQLFRQHA